MNTNPEAIKVLCFGDSNTWGQKPDKNRGRFPANIRWPGKLQELLGKKYYVIEEGLNSRTTDIDYDKKPGRNGKTYLIPCLGSHNPLDVVVIMLGTNDLKPVFKRNAKDVAEALRGLVSSVREFSHFEGKTPKVVLVSPILIDETAELFDMFYAGKYDHESVAQSRNFAAEIQKVVIEENCVFVNAAQAAEPGVDGIHLKEESHLALAALIAETVKTL